MTARATPAEISKLTNWALDSDGKSIKRELKFADFSEAWGFMARVALLERYLPDRTARDRVLVDNPARFFGFA